ncbi:uncharacterized protein PFL1_06101 [Pseudozyma flocculosa PF-1]|nr:uncharacterized protein PFL1_06101 [Pseudozyma flocculosa PF-1]EPQ26453.1 hypothetical protein PFL1_06101 [Pseudozyma flocculosa PF-1]
MPAAKFRPGESPLLQQRVKAYKHVLAHTPPPTSGGKEQAAKEGSSRDTRDPKASSEVKSAWKAHGASVWAKMQSQIWQHASKTDPLAMPEVKAVLEALRKLDGLELYYKVLTHDTMGKAHRKDLISERNGVVYLRLSDHYERMKADNQTRDGRSATKNGTGWGADDWTGDEYRKAHARVIWEMGNKAYAASRFSEAKNEFTFASEFDPTEPVYRLNRAACGVKLKQFADAERDCTDSLALDPTNYKAYFRRGISRAALNKLEEAKRDFDEALRLEKDPKLQAELRKLSEEALKPSKPKRGSQPVQEDPTVQKDVIASISIAPEAASTEGSTNGKAVTITTTSGVTATIPCDSTVSSKGIDKGKGKAKDVEELPSANEIPDASLESSPATSTRPAGKIMFGSIAAVDDAATTNNAASTSAAMSPSSTWGSASAGTSASSSRSSAFGSPATSCVDVPEAGPSDASTKPATGLGLLDSAKVETVSSSIGTALKADSGSGASAMVTDAKPQAGCSAAPARPSRASKAGTQPASSLPAGLKTSTKRSATAQLHHTGSGRTDGQPNGGELGAAVAALEPEVTVLKSRLNAQRELVAWSTRAVEVVSQVEFARCFGMVVERETGVPRQTWIDGELAKLVAWIRTYVDEKREELQVGNQRNRAVGR